MANRGSRNRTGWDEIARKNNTVEQSGHEDPVYESFRSSMKYSQVIPLFFLSLIVSTEHKLICIIRWQSKWMDFLL
jgi:hypothetical protein